MLYDVPPVSQRNWYFAATEYGTNGSLQIVNNPIISFWSQSFKAVDFSQHVCSGVSFTQTQRNFTIQISLHKKLRLL